MLNNLNSETGCSNQLANKKIAALECEVKAINDCINNCIETDIEGLDSRLNELSDNVSTECITATAGNISSLDTNSLTTVNLAADTITTDVTAQNINAQEISANKVTATEGDFTCLTKVVSPTGTINTLNADNVKVNQDLDASSISANVVTIHDSIKTDEGKLTITGTTSTDCLEATNGTINTLSATETTSDTATITTGNINSSTGNTLNYSNGCICDFNATDIKATDITGSGKIETSTYSEFYLKVQEAVGSVYLKASNDEWAIKIESQGENGQFKVTYRESTLGDIVSIYRVNADGKLVIHFNNNSADIDYLLTGNSKFSPSVLFTFIPEAKDVTVPVFEKGWLNHEVIIGGSALSGEHIAGSFSADYFEVEGLAMDNLQTKCLTVSTCATLTESNTAGDLTVCPIIKEDGSCTSGVATLTCAIVTDECVGNATIGTECVGTSSIDCLTVTDKLTSNTCAELNGTNTINCLTANNPACFTCTVTIDCELDTNTISNTCGITTNTLIDKQCMLVGQTTTEDKTSYTLDVGTSCATVTGTLYVNGCIIQNGQGYDTHAEQLYTSCQLIITRDGADYGMASCDYSGIKVNNYDGTNCMYIVTDCAGCLRIGDGDSLQPVATRAEDAQMTNGEPVIWCAACHCLKTSYINIACVSGTVPVCKGGTGLTTKGSAGQFLKVNSAGTALEYGAAPVPTCINKCNGTAALYWDNSYNRLYANSPMCISDIFGNGDLFICNDTNDTDCCVVLCTDGGDLILESANACICMCTPNCIYVEEGTLYMNSGDVIVDTNYCICGNVCGKVNGITFSIYCA